MKNKRVYSDTGAASNNASDAASDCSSFTA